MGIEFFGGVLFAPQNAQFRIFVSEEIRRFVQGKNERLFGYF